MPKLSFPEAVRYFFASFALFCCWTAYDFKSATTTVNALGVLGTLAFLVAGTTIYFVYRSLIYDLFIMPLYDKVQKQNQRKYLKERFAISSTRDANRIIHQLSETEEYTKYSEARLRPLRAASTHLLYQAGFSTLIFAFFTLHDGNNRETLMFIVATSLLLISAYRVDLAYDDEELSFLKSIPDQVDEAASRLGISKRG